MPCYRRIQYTQPNLTSPQSSTIHFGLSSWGHSLTTHFCITSGLKCTGHFTTGSITVTFSPFWSMVCLHMRSLTCWPSPQVLEHACHSCGTQLYQKQKDKYLYQIMFCFMWTVFSVSQLFIAAYQQEIYLAGQRSRLQTRLVSCSRVWKLHLLSSTFSPVVTWTHFTIPDWIPTENGR